jgi:hypothetical protein
MDATAAAAVAEAAFNPEQADAAFPAFNKVRFTDFNTQRMLMRHFKLLTTYDTQTAGHKEADKKATPIIKERLAEFYDNIKIA